jgi:CheY-like chemotaxis protein
LAKRILVVEDDDFTRETMTMLLAIEGFTVTAAANGQEALDKLRAAAPPDLILLDLMMPVKDGWQFRREQAQDPALASIPVVVVSAAGDVGQKAASIGAAGYLQKPVEPGVLLATVRQHDC